LRVPQDFDAAARDLGFELSASDLARFGVYRDRLAGAGFNLSAVRDAEAIERRQFLESLAFGRLLADAGLLEDEPDVIDVGSGAGFPGLPLKLAFPHLHIVLLEVLGKRCRFLESLIAELELEGIEVIEARAEDAGRDRALRENFDVAIARAVAPAPVLLEYCLPFLRLGGHLAATKGSAAVRELDSSGRALALLGGELLPSLVLEPPGGVRQTVVLVRKVAPTPPGYPRRAGIPAKRPLL
jgi:16S rRNA (guanine527-N7)-methyltransferase